MPKTTNSLSVPKDKQNGCKSVASSKKVLSTISEIDNLEDRVDEQDAGTYSKISTKIELEEEPDFHTLLTSATPDNNRSTTRTLKSQYDRQTNRSVECADLKKNTELEGDIQAMIDNLRDPKKLRDLFEKYEPRNKEFDMKTLKASKKTKLKRFKASVYYGEVEELKRHGKGVMIYADARIYEGMWGNDLKNGRGFEILSNGNIYEGDFANGKPHGAGSFIWNNGELYKGEWVEGIKCGFGTWKGIKGESYVGEWRNGKANGYGIHTWSNGDVYEGEIKDFIKHGLGTEKFNNGDKYTGHYVEGRLEGYGEYHWSNGCQYKGNFKDGLRHGKGVWKKTAENGDFYEGDWENDKKHGYGVYTWVSGNCYKGNYVDDMRHGYGEMHWIDGSYYKGAWENGLQQGEGELMIPSKAVKKGRFENNAFVEPEHVEEPKIAKELGILASKKSMSHENLPTLLGARKQREAEELAQIKKIIGKVTERNKPGVFMRRISSIVLHNRPNKRHDSQIENREKLKLNEISNAKAYHSGTKECNKSEISNCRTRRLAPLGPLKILDQFMTERPQNGAGF